MVGTADRSTGVEGVAGGVGLTALMVAAARAIETHRHDTLARDVYAEHFVLAAPASAGWPVRMHQVPDGDANPLWGDSRVLRSADKGPRRLPPPIGTRGRPPSGTARGRVGFAGVPTRLACRLRDLRDRHGRRAGVQTRGARRAGGHPQGRTRTDPDRSARRLGRSADRCRLRHGRTERLAGRGAAVLPVQRRRDVSRRHGGPVEHGGSALAFEAKVDIDLLEYRDNPLYSSTKQQIGVDLLNLFNVEPRPDSAGDLAGRGWSTSVHTPFDFTRRHGRGPLPEQNDALAGNRWVFANKPRP